MIDGAILGVPVVIQGGVILEALAAVLICHEVEAEVEVIAIVAAEGSLWLHFFYYNLVCKFYYNLTKIFIFCSLSPKVKRTRRSLSRSRSVSTL
jgi:hypothetical protein